MLVSVGWPCIPCFEEPSQPLELRTKLRLGGTDRFSGRGTYKGTYRVFGGPKKGEKQQMWSSSLGDLPDLVGRGFRVLGFRASGLEF